MVALDTTTSLIFMVCISTSNGIIGFLLFKTQRNLPGIGLIASGNLLTSASLAFMGGEGIHLITMHNVASVLAQCLICEGIAAFFGRMPRLWLPAGLVVFTIAFWEAIQMVAPDRADLRVLMATILAAMLFGRAAVTILRSKSVAAIARNYILACIGLHMAVMLARCAVALLHPDPKFVMSDPVRPIFFLEVTVMHTLFFYGILIIVGTHLATGLQQQAECLATERRMKAELRQFLHILGHELRTPLAVIDRAAEMIETLLTDPPAAVASRLTSVRATVTRVDDLIDNLLTAERAGLESVSRQPLDLTEIVSDVIATLAEKHGQNRLRLDCAEPALVVVGDRDMLFTAVINVLDNALKYSPATTTVAATLARDGDHAVLRVRDHGIGFPPEQMSRVGQRFFRADNAKVQDGTGLGLHIVKTIASRHGGRLDLRNAPDGGAVVELSLSAT